MSHISLTNSGQGVHTKSYHHDQHQQPQQFQPTPFPASVIQPISQRSSAPSSPLPSFKTLLSVVEPTCAPNNDAISLKLITCQNALKHLINTNYDTHSYKIECPETIRTISINSHSLYEKCVLALKNADALTLENFQLDLNPCEDILFKAILKYHENLFIRHFRPIRNSSNSSSSSSACRLLVTPDPSQRLCQTCLARQPALTTATPSLPVRPQVAFVDLISTALDQLNPTLWHSFAKLDVNKLANYLFGSQAPEFLRDPVHFFSKINAECLEKLLNTPLSIPYLIISLNNRGLTEDQIQSIYTLPLIPFILKTLTVSQRGLMARYLCLMDFYAAWMFRQAFVGYFYFNQDQQSYSIKWPSEQEKLRTLVACLRKEALEEQSHDKKWLIGLSNWCFSLLEKIQQGIPIFLPKYYSRFVSTTLPKELRKGREFSTSFEVDKNYLVCSHDMEWNAATETQINEGEISLTLTSRLTVAKGTNTSYKAIPPLFGITFNEDTLKINDNLSSIDYGYIQGILNCYPLLIPNKTSPEIPLEAENLHQFIQTLFQPPVTVPSSTLEAYLSSQPHFLPQQTTTFHSLLDAYLALSLQLPIQQFSETTTGFKQLVTNLVRRKDIFLSSLKSHPYLKMTDHMLIDILQAANWLDLNKKAMLYSLCEDPKNFIYHNDSKITSQIPINDIITIIEL